MLSARDDSHVRPKSMTQSEWTSVADANIRASNTLQNRSISAWLVATVQVYICRILQAEIGRVWI